jgi:hypothetical protein
MPREKKELKNMTEPELAKLMTGMARSIENVAKSQRVERPSFTLLVFDNAGVTQYISNCERESMILAMRETADRLERREEVDRVAFPDPERN